MCKLRNLQAKLRGLIIWDRIHIKNQKEGNWMKKMKSRSFRILMAAVISAAMLCPQVKVSAADGLVSKAATSYFPSKTVMKKTAR